MMSDNLQTIPAKNGGFTLIELIMVIVILGIVGALGADFIANSFKGFAATEARTEILEEGQAALVRLEREFRNNVPNAVNLQPTGGPYTDLRFGVLDETAMRCDSLPCVFGQYTNVNPKGSITDQSQGLAAGHIISIYNRNWQDFSPSPPDLSSQRIYRVTALGPPDNRKMTLDRNVIATSPNKRYHAVAKGVRFYLDTASDTLRRAEIDINSEGLDVDTQILSATGYPLAQDVTDLNFYYTASTLITNAVLSVEFTISKGGEAINFHKEIHFRNVP